MSASFDRLANSYEMIERVSFGAKLQRMREHGLLAFRNRPNGRALLLGDGNGRFSSATLARNPALSIDSIDSSARMQELAAKRINDSVPNSANRYRTIHANALDEDFGVCRYDFIAIQFFLDCFPERTANRLVQRIEASLKPGGRLIYTDFAIPNVQPWQTISRFILFALYRFFRATTAIKVRQLPYIHWPNTLELVSQRESLKGMLIGEIRAKAEP